MAARAVWLIRDRGHKQPWCGSSQTWPPTPWAGAVAAARGVPCLASPTFEEVELVAELGAGTGIDAGGEARPAWLQWPWVTGVATS